MYCTNGSFLGFDLHTSLIVMICLRYRCNRRGVLMNADPIPIFTVLWVEVGICPRHPYIS